jgi:UDP:flavonoid glycosyltransferase YjiC (YdhE family)
MYDSVPDNVYLDSWFPQPAVLRECRLFVHHGGNNSFCEALYFGLPSVVIPYCWDGHDNARRAEEVGVGAYLPRYAEPLAALPQVLRQLLADDALAARLQGISATMQDNPGSVQAAQAILALTE